MITPQRHLPSSSRLHSWCRYNLIYCSAGAADTIMQPDGTGVITVFPGRWMNKDSQKEGKKMEWWWLWGGQKLTIKTVNYDASGPPCDLCSFTFNTSTTVYLPWLPVIIINVSFSSRHPFRGRREWRQLHGDRRAQRRANDENWQLIALKRVVEASGLYATYHLVLMFITSLIRCSSGEEVSTAMALISFSLN